MEGGGIECWFSGGHWNLVLFTDLWNYNRVGGLYFIDSWEQLITMGDFLPAGGSIRAVPVWQWACGVGEDMNIAKGITEQMGNPDDPLHCGTCKSSNVTEGALNQVQIA